MTDGDIHNRTGKIRNTVERIQNLENQRNSEILLNFKDYLYSEGLSDDRICRRLTSWINLIEHVDFELEEELNDTVYSIYGIEGQEKEVVEDFLNRFN